MLYEGQNITKLQGLTNKYGLLRLIYLFPVKLLMPSVQLQHGKCNEIKLFSRVHCFLPVHTAIRSTVNV